jgi:hypothetical protein
MVCTGRMLTTSSRARSTLLSPMQTEEVPTTKVAIRSRSMAIFSGSLPVRPHAPGGAKNYVVGGKMTGGFAFIAYPAEYRSSGVMTFIVDEAGAIYEKDLGPNTTKLAETMTAYDPDSTWHQAE